MRGAYDLFGAHLDDATVLDRVDGDPHAGREAGSSVYLPLAQGLWSETSGGLENVLSPSSITDGAWAGIDSWAELEQAVS